MDNSNTDTAKKRHRLTLEEEEGPVVDENIE